MPVPRYVACETAWHIQEKHPGAVRVVVQIAAINSAVVPIFPVGTYRRDHCFMEDEDDGRHEVVTPYARSSGHAKKLTERLRLEDTAAVVA